MAGIGFEVAQWPSRALTDDLIDLAALGSTDNAAPSSTPPLDRVLDWLAEQLGGGTTPEELCEAALWLGLRHTRVEGRGPRGLVSHVVLAAHASAAIGEHDPATATIAAAQLVAYAVGDRNGGVHDEREGPTSLSWFAPAAGDGDPVQDFLDAALEGECDLADHRWLRAAEHDPAGAVAALVSAGAAGYHLNEHKVIYPAQLLAWCERRGGADPVLLRAAARFAANHLQDPEHAVGRRADAGVLADMAAMDLEELGGSGLGAGDLDGTALAAADGGLAAADGDLARISTVATGLARTPPRELPPLLLGSLQDGLSPKDLVHAAALVYAARFADTGFGDRSPVQAIHAGTGTNALRRCIEASTSLEAIYELALCATESPSACHLAPIEELTVPPSDDGALEDLLDALDDGDPDAAADAASAVSPDESGSTDAAWAAIRAAAVRDQSMFGHAVKHVVAMDEDFHASAHPARGWFLAAAARTAAHATAGPTDLADAITERLLS